MKTLKEIYAEDIDMEFLQAMADSLSEHTSVSQGHTRDDPSHVVTEATDTEVTFESIEHPWDYELPTLPDDETDLPQESKTCDHFWYVTGHSPLDNKPYENCKYCDMRREDYDTNN